MSTADPSTGADPGGTPEEGDLVAVYRTLPSRVLGWSMTAAVGVVGYTVVSSELSLGRGVLFPISAVCFVVVLIWILLLRPSVELRSESVTQRNILKDTTVPFSRLSDITYAWSLELTDTAGRRHSSWAVPKQREFSARRAFDNFGETTARRQGRPGTTAQTVAGDVQREYQRWLLDGGALTAEATVQPRWALAAVLPLGLSLGLLVVSVFVTVA
ncbi:MAG: hypothetical protein WBA72_03950 [Ornithinimicrobium sp.]